MEEKFKSDQSRCKKCNRTLKIMKISFLMFFSAFFTITAGNVFSQQKELSLELNNVTIKKAISKIEKTSDYVFLITDEARRELDKKISIRANKESIQTILENIFNGTDLAYTTVERQVTVYKNPKPITTDTEEVAIIEPEQQGKTVKGKVLDGHNEPLPGVTIVIKGTSSGTISNQEGDYLLPSVPENAVLVFSFVGMKPVEIGVENKSVVNVTLEEESIGLDEVVAIGYGTVKKSDLTGSVSQIKAEKFRSQSMTQLTDMLTGTIAGFIANQSTSAQGGSSMEIRGPTSLTASTYPLIVVDGVIFNGALRDINPYDIESIDILKDASSAAVFGSKSASGVVLITTTKGKRGTPSINVSAKLGITENYNERRGLNPEEYIQFRQDFFRQMFPDNNYHLYSHPNELPSDMTIDEWRNLTPTPLDDNIKEWMARLRLFPIEQENYLAGKTMDMYDEVFKKGLRQEYDVSIAGGTEVINYYWSVGYNNNEGIRVGDKYASVRSRLNADFRITDWLKTGINTQFTDRDESSVPASLSFYVNSPYGQMFDSDGNLIRWPHGHSDNPLLDYYRRSLSDKTYNLFTNIFAEVSLPFGFKYKFSAQPFYQSYKYLTFITISKKLGGEPNEIPSGERREATTMNWMIDNLITWNKTIGIHNFDLTLLANVEENRYWSSTITNKNFSPNQELGYHGLHFGDSPEITVNDSRSTGDALMARLNYNLLGKYLFTTSIRRDGFSAFGLQNPRAVFPALAFAWNVSDEKFFDTNIIDRMKLRVSWGVNGNRDIGIYSALARTNSSLWYDGKNVRVGTFNSSLANSGLKWERTSSFNLGVDMSLLKKISITADVYQMYTKDLLMNRVLPRITGFDNITSNLGLLSNKGLEVTLNSTNISNPKFSWESNLAFSLNRNKIEELFGDFSTYMLLNEERTNDVPDFTNGWFPGEDINVVWDYDVVGIWQTNEAEEAKKYGMLPGDFKAVDVNNDGRYVDVIDKKFIGYTTPRYRIGLRNDFNFLQNFSLSVFLRSDLGHIGSYSPALNGGYESNDRWNRNVGPVPYWTVDRPNNEYARLNVNTGGYGGGLMIYKPRSFVRIQDVSLSYNMPQNVSKMINADFVRMFFSVRNLATFTKWPGWDPESGMNPMPRTFTIGFNFTL